MERKTVGGKQGEEEEKTIATNEPIAMQLREKEDKMTLGRPAFELETMGSKKALLLRSFLNGCNA